MLENDKDDERPLHVNVRGEMTLIISRLIDYLTETIIKKRIADRDITLIDADDEYADCFGEEGKSKIAITAAHFYKEFWLKKMEERWLPKSAKALERENNPPPSAKLAVKPVKDKHFISRWFIRDHWAEKDRTTRWRWDGITWNQKSIRFGSWGHRQNLWNDRLEAYFALLEGDAKLPINMLLNVEPLNPPQMKAFIGFVVVHLLRNPKFIRALRAGTREVVQNAGDGQGISFDEMAIEAFGTLFKNNDLYRAYANPIFASPWAIVRSERPVFVLPDTFCARAAVDGASRLVLPLSPHKCFVTLKGVEEEKRIVPYQINADEQLATMLSQLLISAAENEFLSHADFCPTLNESEPTMEHALERLEELREI